MDNDKSLLNNLNKQGHIANIPFYAYDGDEPYIFVSYAHKDAAIVFPEIKRFHDDGYNIWYDQGIAPGNEWPEEIAEALEGCSLFIVFITSNSVDSINVRNEINYALSSKKPFLAIYLEETELKGGVKLRISSLQGILKYTTTEEEYVWRYRKVFKQHGFEMRKPSVTKSLDMSSQTQTESQLTETFHKIKETEKSDAKSSEYLEDFESLNTTTESIYNLEGHEVLIILDDGTNLTSWSNYERKSDIVYISEDLSKHTNLSERYKNMISLKAIIATGVTNKVRDITWMFNNCDSLEYLIGLSNWDTSKVKNMRGLFEGCESLEDISALSNWNTSKVTNMSELFEGCESLMDVSALSNWNTSKVTEMDRLFADCESLEDISALSNWNTPKLNFMRYTFGGCESLEDISALSNWNTSKVTEMSWLFGNCASLEDVSVLNNWNTSKVKNMEHMFENCDEIKEYPEWYNE